MATIDKILMAVDVSGSMGFDTVRGVAVLNTFIRDNRGNELFPGGPRIAQDVTASVVVLQGFPDEFAAFGNYVADAASGREVAGEHDPVLGGCDR